MPVALSLAPGEMENLLVGCTRTLPQLDAESSKLMSIEIRGIKGNKSTVESPKSDQMLNVL